MEENNSITQNSLSQEKPTNDTEPLEYLVKRKNDAVISPSSNFSQKIKKIPFPITKNENLLKKYEIEYGIDDSGNPMDVKYYYKNINSNTSNLSKSRISGISTIREPKPIAFIVKDKTSNNNILIDLKGNPILNKNKDGDYEFPLKFKILIKNFDVQHPELRVNGERNNTNKNELFLLEEEINNTNENILPIDSTINDEILPTNNENNTNIKNVINLRNVNNKLNISKSFSQIKYVIKKKNYIKESQPPQQILLEEKKDNISKTYSNSKINIKLYSKNYGVLARTKSILNKNKKLFHNIENKKKESDKTLNSITLFPKINSLFSLKNNTSSSKNDKKFINTETDFTSTQNSKHNIDYLNTCKNRTTINNTIRNNKNVFLSIRDLLPKVSHEGSSSITKNLVNYQKYDKTKNRNNMDINDENNNYINKIQVAKIDIYNKKKEFNFKKIPIYPEKLKRKMIKCSVLTKEADTMIKNYNSKKEVFNLKNKKLDNTFNRISSISYLFDKKQKLSENNNTFTLGLKHKKSSIFLFGNKKKLSIS